MIERTLFREEHNIFRESVRKFVETEITPYHAQWEKDGIVPRELWLKAGEQGLLCCTVPEEYGGLGLDYLFDVVVFEELWRAGASGPGFMIHTDLVATYILSFGTEEQKKKWLPKMVSGEAIGSLGMTEPHAGSDLKAIKTRATRDGDDFVINGQKVFISNGQMCDVIVLATKTDKDGGAKGVTLFLVEGDRDGFRRGKNLEKLGMHAQDTSELFFDNVRVPATNMLGEEGKGFGLMMTKLSQERLAQAMQLTNAVIDVFLPLSDAIRREHLGESRSVVVMRRGHPLAEQGLTLDRYLAADHLIVTSRPQGLGPEDTVLARDGLRRKIRARCLQANTAMRMVASSNILLTMAEGFAQRANMWFDNVFLPVPFEAEVVDTYLYWHENADADPANRWFRSLVRAAAAEALMSITSLASR